MCCPFGWCDYTVSGRWHQCVVGFEFSSTDQVVVKATLIAKHIFVQCIRGDNYTLSTLHSITDTRCWSQKTLSIIC